MVFKKGNNQGRPKLIDFSDLTPETKTYIDQLILKTFSYAKIKSQLEKKNIKISVPELRKNIKTLNEKSTLRTRNRIKRVFKSQVDSWIDGSDLTHSDNFSRPKKSRTLYINENGKRFMFKIYAYTDIHGRKDIIIIKTETRGEKAEHFKELLVKVSLKGWLKNIKTISVDQQLSINPKKKRGKEMLKFLTLNNSTLVRQEKSQQHPYQSEVEGMFGTVKVKMIKWFERFNYTEVKEIRTYEVTTDEIMEQFNTIREAYIYNNDITPDFNLVEVEGQKVAPRI